MSPDLTSSPAASVDVESERRYRLLFDANPVPMWVFDRETLEFLAVNQAAVEHYGYSREELQAMTIKDIRPPEDVPVLLAARSAPWTHGRTSLPGTFRHRRKDGTLILVEVVSHAIDWEGRPARLVLATDVTARQATEDAIRASESRFRELAEAVHEVFYVSQHDSERRPVRIEYVSSAYTEIWGRDVEELYADPMSWLAAVHPDDRARVRAGLEGRGDGVFEAEYRVVRPDGGVRWVRDRTFPIRNADGRPTGRVAGAAQDITAERAAMAEVARLAAIVESTDDAILSKTADGIIRTCNPGAERLFGRSAGDMVGRRIFDLVPPEQHEHERALLRRAAAGEHVVQYDGERVRRDGTRVPVAVTLSPILDANGAVVGISSITRNVAERRRLEAELRQAQKMEAVGRLAGGIAHDFNNLLTAIRGNADFLAAELAPDTQARADVEEIRLAADRAAGLTRQLLAFSRKQVLQAREVDVDDVVENVERLLRRVIGEDVRLQTELAASPSRVLADPGQLEQVLLNLAVNARDAMPEGGTLLIRTAVARLDSLPPQAGAVDAPHGAVLLSVSDSGTGMDDATRSRAFEPFFTTKEPGKGTGLGLSTVFGIARQSGGTVWLDSVPGTGTTVWLAFPVSLAPVSARTPVRGVDTIPGARGTVLLVEDEHAVRALTSRVLSGAGYRVLAASDGHAARALWDAHGGAGGVIDAVVSDVVMPERSGRDLVRALREERPELPVVFMSGYVEGGLAGDLGLRTEFLEKPFPAQRLLESLASLLERSHAAG